MGFLATMKVRSGPFQRIFHLILPMILICVSHGSFLECPMGSNEPSCIVENDTNLYCCHLLNFADTIQSFNFSVDTLKGVQHLYMTKCRFTVLPTTLLKHFKNIITLSVTESNLTHIQGNFENHNTIQYLNLSRNQLELLPKRIFCDLKNLISLDLGGNALNVIEENCIPELRHLKYLDLSGNDWACMNREENVKMLWLLRWIEEGRGDPVLQSRNRTLCSQMESKISFLKEDSSGKRTLLYTLEKRKEVEKSCPRIGNQKCTCDFAKMLGTRYGLKVMCVNMGLTELPSYLPKNTVSLDISDNKITSLLALKSNSHYSNIQMLFADNNDITSIEDIEWSFFFNNTQYLSLTNNALTYISPDFLENMLRLMPSQGEVKLGNNPFTCECGDIIEMKIVIYWYWYQLRVSDYENITCRNSGKKIGDIPVDFCSSQEPDYEFIAINCGIAIEAMILILLIVKVTYDRSVFKKSGHLPWPANKLPT